MLPWKNQFFVYREISCTYLKKAIFSQNKKCLILNPKITIFSCPLGKKKTNFQKWKRKKLSNEKKISYACKNSTYFSCFSSFYIFLYSARFCFASAGKFLHPYCCLVIHSWSIFLCCKTFIHFIMIYTIHKMLFSLEIIQITLKISFHTFSRNYNVFLFLRKIK